ncbi:SDR family NAD(P)-dependent oxidoreductase [Devosia sp.]|uniref:SDR family NAD(P)-dependent oxidoreductase n=1 Tax=Devosia sp. TaxID=1871048 RepID=UPI002EDDBDF6
MRLRHKSALITGCARGIGAATARMFARQGARLVIGDVLEGEGGALAEAIAQAGGEAVFTRLDVTSEADWERAAELAVGHYGGLDILVNNAGIGAGNMAIEQTSADDWDRVMAVNAKGAFLGMRACLPALRAAGGGAIVNLSSQLGLVGTDNSSAQYQASKGAVRMLTKSAAVRYAKAGIRVNSVHPGPVATPLTASVRSDPEARDVVLSRIPLGRYGEDEEVAYGIVYLASDEARFVTGTELIIDGGWTSQ